MMEKKSNYAKYVREMYQPKVSQTKVHELEQIKEQLVLRNTRKATTDTMSNKSNKQSRFNNKVNNIDLPNENEPYLASNHGSQRESTKVIRKKKMNWEIKKSVQS